jgi:hypothetical protein
MAIVKQKWSALAGYPIEKLLTALRKVDLKPLEQAVAEIGL